MRNRPNWLVNVLVFLMFTGGGGLFFVIGLIFFLDFNDYRTNGLPATGTITSVRDSSDSDGTIYYPTVQFKIANGKAVEFEGKLGTSGSYQVGDQVKVYYKASNPGDARLDDNNSWIFPLVFMGLGGLCVVLGLVITFFAGFSSRRRPSGVQPAPYIPPGQWPSARP